MTIREIKEMNRQIAQLLRKLERLKSDVFNVTPSLTGLPGAGNVADKLGAAVAEIADAERQIAELRERRDSELSRLSTDVDEENCIYLFLVRRYSWRRIAQITGGRMDTVGSIKKRCYRYEW